MSLNVLKDSLGAMSHCTNLSKRIQCLGLTIFVQIASYFNHK
jgi:hypothetical protein